MDEVVVYGYVGQSVQQVGGDCPEGWIKMQGLRPDDNSVATLDGSWKYPTSETFDEDMIKVRAVLNPLRDTFLNRLAGIALFSSDQEIKDECASLRVKLLDITKDAAFIEARTYEDMEDAILSAYKKIILGCSESFKSVFRDLEVR